MRVALTGVPGTGKTTLARALAARGARVVDLNEFARERGLLGEPDPERSETRVVDLDALADALNEALGDGEAGAGAHAGAGADARPVVVEGHFAHEMDVDRVVLLRLDPLVLVERLRARGWPDAKVRENVEAEALDVLAAEVIDAGLPAWEVDLTGKGVEEAADAVWRIVESGSDDFMARSVGSARWSLESLPWFSSGTG